MSVAYLLLVTVLPLPVITHSEFSLLCRLYVILVTMFIVSCMALAIDFVLLVFVNILGCALKQMDNIAIIMWLLEHSVALVDSTSRNLYIDTRADLKVPRNTLAGFKRGLLLRHFRVPVVCVMG